MSAQSHTISGSQFLEINGLPNTSINAIAQDRDGYIWIGTSNGLIRYDGYRFVTYKNIGFDPTSINDNGIRALFVDYYGQLWVGTTSLSRYDKKCDCFTNYPVVPAVNYITEDNDHNLWIGTRRGGLHKYDQGSKQFSSFFNKLDDAITLVEDQINVILIDRNRHIWIGTGYPLADSDAHANGLLRFDPATGNVEQYLHDPQEQNSLIDNRVTALLEDREGRLLVGTSQSGLHYYHADINDFVRIKPDPVHPNQLHAREGNRSTSPTPFVQILYQSKNDGFWIGTFGVGLSFFDLEENTQDWFSHDPASTGPFKNNLVWAILEDMQNHIWVGNKSEGLYKLNQSAPQFQIYQSVSDRIMNPAVMRIQESPSHPGVVWYATYGGGFKRLDLKTSEIVQYRHQVNDTNSLSNDIVRAVYEDASGVVWLGVGSGVPNGRAKEGGDGGLDRFNYQTGVFTHFDVIRENTTNFSNTVYEICDDKKGHLFLGTGTGGLWRFDKANGSLKQLPFPDASATVSDREVFAIFMDSHQTIWVGNMLGKSGLYKYRSSDDTFIPYLEGFQPFDVIEDSSGWFWIATASQGLLHFNPVNGNFKQYTAEDGLTTNEVSAVLLDDNGTLWLSTELGIAQFDPSTNKIIENHLPDYKFLAQSGCVSREGQLFFGANTGVVSFFPDQVSGNPFLPEVHIVNLSISGEDFDLISHRSDGKKSIVLSHNQNDLVFEFLGIHYTDPEKNQYQFRVDPYDPGWIIARTDRTARYTNLDPGSYTFHVKAANSHGTWNEEGDSIKFNIRVPWWQTWWAYLIAGITLAIGSYSFYRFQLSKRLVIEEGNRLREMDQLKNSLYTNITHEFRTPLTVINGMADELERNPTKDASKKLGLIKRNSHSLLHMVDQMLKLSKLQAGKESLELRQGNVLLYVQYLVEANESLARLKDISLNFYAEEQELLMDFDAQKLKTILSNLISNAVKFTEVYGKVLVIGKKVRRAGDDFLEVQVRDSGAGIAAEQLPFIFDRFHQVKSDGENQGIGIGLALVKELVSVMHGEIHVESELNKSTVFTLRLPVNNNAPLGQSDLISKTEPAFGLSFDPNELIMDHVVEDNDLPVLLIIEDNLDVIYYLQVCLETRYKIETCRNGLDGLERAYEMIPDIIISDVMMPKMDGFEVCAKLKEDDRTNHIPIILLTAKATLEDKLEGLSRGADAYLIKPFEKEELVMRLEKLMLLRQTLQQKYSQGPLTDTREEENPEDQASHFIKKVEKEVLANLEDDTFSVNELAKVLYLSRSQVHRKIKALTGMSTSIFIRRIRLLKAKKLICSTDLSISEVVYAVGFRTPTYFSQVFKETFGENPSAMRTKSKIN